MEFFKYDSWKDIELGRLSWISQADSIYNHEHTNKREIVSQRRQFVNGNKDWSDVSTQTKECGQCL